MAKGDGTVLKQWFRPLRGTSLKFSTQISSGQSCPLFPYQCCDWPNRLKPPHITETCFPCHITSASIRINSVTLQMEGTMVAQWLRCCATNWKVASSIPAGVIGFFIDIKSFRSHYGPGVDSASNRNEYQEYFLGVNAAGA